MEETPELSKEQVDKERITLGNVVENMVDLDSNMECFGTGMEVECLIDPVQDGSSLENKVSMDDEDLELGAKVQNLALLISPFFFWGTSMAVMKVKVIDWAPVFVWCVDELSYVCDWNQGQMYCLWSCSIAIT